MSELRPPISARAGASLRAATPAGDRFRAPCVGTRIKTHTFPKQGVGSAAGRPLTTATKPNYGPVAWAVVSNRIRRRWVALWGIGACGMAAGGFRGPQRFHQPIIGHWFVPGCGGGRGGIDLRV